MGVKGQVYRVRQKTTGTILALKMILCARGATFLELARFRIEAEAMACLNHPNIVKIRDVGVFEGYPFFALDFAEKGSLKQVIRGQPQSPTCSAEWVRTLALAMQHAHGRGMLHRDLKPANVLVMGDETLKISDFGLVKFAAPLAKVSEECCTFSVSVLDQELIRYAQEFQAQYRPLMDGEYTPESEIVRLSWQECAKRTGLLGDTTRSPAIRDFLASAKQQARTGDARKLTGLDDLTCSGSVMGSPQYMAPEQASGNLRDIGPCADVYALGGILYELLTGQPPFRSANLAELLTQVVSQPPLRPRLINPTIPPEIEAICLKCLEKNIGRRYSTATWLEEDLRKFLDQSKHAANGPPPAAGTRQSGVDNSWEAGTTRSKPIPQDKRRTRSWWPFGRAPK